jgi:hypothetical protein
VAESRVEASGCFFLVVLAPGAEEGRVVAEAMTALRGRAARLEPAAAAAQLAARPRGDPWLSAREIVGLSYVEARIVATTTAARVAAQAGLDGRATAAVAEALRLELFAAVERVHAEGGRESSAWFYAAWPAIAAAAADRSAAALGPEARGPAAAALRDARAPGA